MARLHWRLRQGAMEGHRAAKRCWRGAHVLGGWLEALKPSWRAVLLVHLQLRLHLQLLVHLRLPSPGVRLSARCAAGGTQRACGGGSHAPSGRRLVPAGAAVAGCFRRQRMRRLDGRAGNCCCAATAVHISRPVRRCSCWVGRAGLGGWQAAGGL